MKFYKNHRGMSVRCLALAFCLLPPLLAAGEVTIDKPARDDRQYQFVTLPNALRVLLISDPDTDKAAASLDIHVGYFDDPPERPGLAHFLEHMLFLGTEKYPRADDYQEFLSAHGGRHNAYTAAQHTNYFFDVDRDHLQGALDRFAQFFVAPLFNEAFVAREFQAVDSEYRLKIKDDDRRFWEVQKATANPAHPFTKFSVGSKDTLLGNGTPQQLRQALIRFHRERYSANLMTLVVLGKEPLPALRRMVTDYFSSVPNRGTVRTPPRAPLFLPQQKGVWINIVPVKERRSLRLSFPLPWQEAYHRTKPTLLLSHLLGHEGPGSLFQLLRKRGWINSLRAGTDLVTDNEATLDITIDLTAEGLDYVSSITALVFQYIALMRQAGVAPWLYDELRRMNDLAFHYREPPPPLSEVRRLAADLHRYPPQKILRGPYEFTAYGEDFLRDLLARLVPENMRLTLMAPDLPTRLQEPHYQAPYQITPLADALRQRWRRQAPHPALSIPAPNPFLPEHAALKPLADLPDPLDGNPPRPVPALIHEEPGLHVWHAQDREFRIPRAHTFVILSTPLADDTPAHSLLTRLYLMLVNDRLSPLAYQASLAGLHYGVDPGKGAILLRLGGYDEKQPLLLDRLLDALLNLRIDPRRFAVKKDQLRLYWQNSRHDRPYRQLNRELGVLLQHKSWPPDIHLAALRTLQPETLAAFIPRLLASVHIDLLSHGNLTATEARDMARTIADRLRRTGRLAQAPVPRRYTLLAPGREYLRRLDIEHEDAAVLVYYQAPADDPATEARVRLLQRLVKGPFFHLLRTTDQLGYIVFASPYFVQNRPGLRFIVQSPGHGPSPILARMDTFLDEDLPDLLAGISEEEFRQYRNGLLNDILKKDDTLGERSHRFFGQLTLGDHDFSRREHVAAEVARIGKQDLIAFFRAWLGNPETSRLVITAPGRHATLPPAAVRKTLQRRLIEDAGTFKQSLPAGELRGM